MKRRNIMIDCDPGIDDTIAISYAVANQNELNLLGITTVAGNQTIEIVAGNARKLMAFYGLQIPVAVGAIGPLLGEQHNAAEFHGANGMGNVELPVSDIAFVKEHAVEFIKNTLLASEEAITLVAIGPLTNIALLLKMYPEVKEKIELISIMGGAAAGGNATPSAEFNTWADPEAAKIVFDSDVPIVMNGLDVTNRALLHKDDMLQLKQGEGKFTKVLGNILEFYFAGCHSGNESFAIHDVSAIMYLLHPEIYQGTHTKVLVDCSEGLNRGNTCCDLRSRSFYESTAPLVLHKIDSEKFREILMEALLRLDTMY